MDITGNVLCRGVDVDVFETNIRIVGGLMSINDLDPQSAYVDRYAPAHLTGRLQTAHGLQLPCMSCRIDDHRLAFTNVARLEANKT